MSFAIRAAAFARCSTPRPLWAQHQGHGRRPPAPPAQTIIRPAPPAPQPITAAMVTGRCRSARRGHAMAGALGPYPMSREASGTAWQPDASQHGGLHVAAGDWTLMGHATLNGVYDWQAGPARRRDGLRRRHGDGHGAARRSGDGTLQLRAMLSPDPLMGRRGYPLLLAAGETADGVDPLRRPPAPARSLHGAVGQLLSCRSGRASSLFLYGGLPGEPAFGPPAFMHRMSIMDSPEAPITHHWLDSTHITFGVVTAGLVVGQLSSSKARASTAASRTSTAGTSRPGRSIRPRSACPGTRPRTCRCRRAGRG